jgi:hypothetical protein
MLILYIDESAGEMSQEMEVKVSLSFERVMD